MSERNLHHDMTDAERRLHNVAMLGQVLAIDTTTARVRVQAGPITSGWLPFVTLRAGHDRSWHPPEPGEQVLLVAPGGELNQAVVVGSIYRQAHPAPADSIDISRTVYKDGAVAEYDRAQHHWRLSVPEGGHIRFEIGGTVLELTAEGVTLTTAKLVVDAPDSTFTGNIKSSGNINAAGSVIDGGGNTNHHSH